MTCTTKMTTMSTTKMRKRTTSDVSPSVEKKAVKPVNIPLVFIGHVPILSFEGFPSDGMRGVNGRKFVTGRT